jgi:biopolymer transport protein ExbD
MLHTRRKTSMVSAEMDLKPFMNLMVVLIPMLLLSAEFAKVAVIDIDLPKDRGSTPKRTYERFPDDANHLKLTAILTDSVVTLGARGGFLPSIHYREFHRYVARDDQSEFTVEYVPGKKVLHPVTGREMLPQERHDILLYACDENRSIIKGFYSEFGELLTDANGVPVQSMAAGDEVFTLSNPRRRIVVGNPSEFMERNLSAYDVLLNRLMKLKKRFRDAEDADRIIIAAENSILYDKIVQVMDNARKAEYPDIMISKVRS